MKTRRADVLLAGEPGSGLAGVRERLREAGFNVLVALPTETALAGIPERDLDAVFLDSAAGVEALARIRTVLPRCPVVVLGSLHDDVLTDRFLEAGAAEVLREEDLEPRSLCRALDRASARARWQQGGGMEELLRQYELMKSLFSIVSKRSLSTTMQIGEVLRLGCELFGMRSACVGRVEGETCTLEHVHAPGADLRIGRRQDLPSTPGAILWEEDRALGIEDLAVSQWSERSCVRSGVRSFIGAPLLLEGARHGTLVFWNDAARASRFTELEMEFAETLGEWVETLLTRDRLKRDLQLLTDYDPLTGLHKRKSFLRKLEGCVNRAGRNRNGEYVFSVVFVELEGFGEISEALGHLNGDLLLKGVARRLGSGTRPKDTIGRFAGDQFVVLLEDSATDGALIAARRLLPQLEAPFTLEGKEIRIGVQIRICCSEDYRRVEDMLRDAEMGIIGPSGRARSDADRIRVLEPRELAVTR